MANDAKDYFERVLSLYDKPAPKLPDHNPDKHLDETRANLARAFVIAYFVALATVWFGTLWYNIVLLSFFCPAQNCVLVDAKEMLLVVSGIIGPSLGFVVGYYFKESTK